MILFERTVLIKSLPEDRVVDDFAILSRPFIFTVVDAANLESDIVDKAIDNMRKHAASGYCQVIADTSNFKIIRA